MPEVPAAGGPAPLAEQPGGRNRAGDAGKCHYQDVALPARQERPAGAREKMKMTSQRGVSAPPAGPDRQEAARRAEVALWSFGQLNSVVREFDFWDDSYEGRRLFSERPVTMARWLGPGWSVRLVPPDS